jgi:phage terminase small subunit
MTTMQLSDRQERFIHEYLLDLNAAAAARRAGYADSTRGRQAADLMKNPAIRERIDLALAGMFAELDINAMSLMRERARAALDRKSVV